MIRAALLDALAVLSPVRCAGCGADDRALCTVCRASLVGSPRILHLDGLDVTSALQYDGPVRRAVLALKEQSRTDIARALATPMRAAILQAVNGPVELVTVPPSTSSSRARGFDPVKLLIARAQLPRPASVLVHTRSTAAQKTLDAKARDANLAGSLRARHPLTGRRFLLVDDVVTTGATLREAARAVRAAGGEVIGSATLAHTPKRFDQLLAGDSGALQ